MLITWFRYGKEMNGNMLLIPIWVTLNTCQCLLVSQMLQQCFKPLMIFFRDSLNRFVFVFLDDILIYSRDIMSGGFRKIIGKQVAC